MHADLMTKYLCEVSRRRKLPIELIEFKEDSERRKDDGSSDVVKELLQVVEQKQRIIEILQAANADMELQMKRLRSLRREDASEHATESASECAAGHSVPQLLELLDRKKKIIESTQAALSRPTEDACDGAADEEKENEIIVGSATCMLTAAKVDLNQEIQDLIQLVADKHKIEFLQAAYADLEQQTMLARFGAIANRVECVANEIFGGF